MRLGMMWAGVTDGYIATGENMSNDDYTPLSVAFFKTRAEAERYYERVLKVDADKMFAVEKEKA